MLTQVGDFEVAMAPDLPCAGLEATDHQIHQSRLPGAIRTRYGDAGLARHRQADVSQDRRALPREAEADLLNLEYRQAVKDSQAAGALKAELQRGILLLEQRGGCQGPALSLALVVVERAQAEAVLRGLEPLTVERLLHADPLKLAIQCRDLAALCAAIEHSLGNAIPVVQPVVGLVLHAPLLSCYMLVDCSFSCSSLFL
mmetsp:Transcript_12628/g.34885  ORF Transcript_12628/g.34885 Transcript_12628/m.34885 type:complete len:200 (-) Transcript_12628:471-1070(-)